MLISDVETIQLGGYESPRPQKQKDTSMNGLGGISAISKSDIAA